MLVVNPNAVNPTWKKLVTGSAPEALSFVKSIAAEALPAADSGGFTRITDPTGWKLRAYQSQKYAAILYNKAEQAGIRAGFVSIELTVPGELYTVWYYLVAFQTTDNGLVYLQNIPQAGGTPLCTVLMARIVVGQPYSLSFLPDIPEYYTGFYVNNSGWGAVKTLQVDW